MKGISRSRLAFIIATLMIGVLVVALGLLTSHDNAATAETTQVNAEISLNRQDRRLPGDYDFDMSQEQMESLLCLLVVICLVSCLCSCLCCRAGGCSLTEILACVCLYEICCDDGRVGGFDLMPV